MLRSSSALLAIVIACGILGTALPAAAQPDPTESAALAARSDFAEGQGHFRAKRWADALRSFERSYAGVSSPNTQLMIARCLRELGRGPDAAAAFASAEAEARRRVTRGESKYGDTAEAAASEGNAVRASLGTMKIHVSGGATLTVDRNPVALSRDGDATVFHEPGSVQVSVKDSAGAEQRQTVTVTAGTTVTMEFSAEGRPAPVAPLIPERRREALAPAPEKEAPGWTLPAALVSGGLTLAGTGVFIGFGASSRATYDTLAARCGPSSCGEESRAEADAGRMSQTIANIGLGVAIAGAVATVVVLYLGLTNQKVTPAGRGL